jgi:hypothetical protein
MITIDDLRPFITFDSTDEIFIEEQLIPSAEAWVVTYLGYNPGPVDYVEYIYLHSFQNDIALKNFPILTMTKLELEGEEITDFWRDDRAGIIKGRGFYPGLYEATYQAGQAVLPADLKGAVCELVAGNWMRIKSEGYGVKSKIVGDSTINLETGVSWSVRQVLDRYKN